MTDIRTKDKLFLAAAVPLALLAAYIYGWRTDAAKRIRDLDARSANLVAEEDFAEARLRADRAFAEAKAELEAERAIPFPRAQVKADASETAAERERAVLDVFRSAGLTVVGSASADAVHGGRAQPGRAGDVLKATGTRPEPLHRAYTLDGRYPDVVRAMEAFDRKEMAVVADGVEMRNEGRGRWTVNVWL